MPRPDRLFTLVALIGLIAGVWLRFAALDRFCLGSDELASLRRARELTLSEHLRAMRGGHPLHEIAVLRPWAKLTDSDAGLRFPSALAGALTLLAVWRLGGLFGPAAGALSVWLLAVSPLHVMFSRIARPYALATLLAALSCWILARIVTRADAGTMEARHGGRMAWRHAAYALTTAALIWSNLFGLSLAAAHGTFLIWHWRKEPRRLLPWVVTGLATVLLAAPWLAFSAGPALVWSRETVYAEGQLGFWAKALYLPFALTLGQTAHPLTLWAVVPAALAFGTASGFGLWAARRTPLAVLLWLAILAGYAAALGFGAAGVKHVMVILPAFLVALVLGARELRRWGLATAMLAAMLALSVFSLTNYFRGRDFHDADMATPWREIAGTIAARERPRELIMVGYRADEDVLRMFKRYYKGNLPVTWLGADAESWTEQVEKAVESGNSVWLLLHETDPREAIEKELTSRGLIGNTGIWEFQMEEHTLRGLREGLGMAHRYRSPLYKLYRLSAPSADGGGTMISGE